MTSRPSRKRFLTRLTLDNKPPPKGTLEENIGLSKTTVPRVTNAAKINIFQATFEGWKLVQVRHICWVGCALLLAARQRRRRGPGITLAVRVAAAGEHCKGEHRGAGDGEASSRDKHGASSTNGRENLMGSTHPKCIAHREEPIMMSHPRPKGRSSTRTLSFSPPFQGLLISSKFRSDVSIPPGLAVGAFSMISPENMVVSVTYCRMAGSVAVKAIIYPQPLGLALTYSTAGVTDVTRAPSGRLCPLPVARIWTRCSMSAG